MAEWTPEDEADELEIIARPEKDPNAPTWSKKDLDAGAAALDAMFKSKEEDTKQ